MVTVMNYLWSHMTLNDENRVVLPEPYGSRESHEVLAPDWRRGAEGRARSGARVEQACERRRALLCSECLPGVLPASSAPAGQFQLEKLALPAWTSPTSCFSSAGPHVSEGLPRVLQSSSELMCAGGTPVGPLVPGFPSAWS